MAFFRLVLYASKLKRITEKLKAEKEAASAISRKEKPKYGWRLKLAHVWINLRKRIRNFFINLYFLRNTAFDRFLYRLRKYGSLENYILKSILGFIGGYLLTYLLFLFLAVQLNVRLSVATLICCFIGCVLTIGLAFSQNIRCIVFLTLPQFFSKRGRQALIAYALILTMTGPAKNTLNNMGIMSESLACGQEQLKSAVRQIIDVIKKPFVAIKEALKAVVKAVKEVIKKIKEILIKIKRVIMAIIGVIKSVFEFLGRVLSLCNKELGTPFQRCSRVFETAIADCQASLGPFFSWACSLGYLVNAVCYIVKPFDLVCMLVDFISNSIIGVVIRKIKIFVRHVKTMFYVRIKFSHSYHFESKSSKSMKDIANSIVAEVKTRTKEIVSVFEIFNCAASLFFIFLISRVIHYRHQFLTKERFDNKFLTKNLVNIDLRRAAMEKETIFPLNHRERKKYITIKSVRLLPKERKQLTEGLGLLMSTALKVGTHMAIDYSLFWIMNLIRKYGKFQSKVQPPNVPTMHIAGQGLLADLLKAVVKSFQPIGISLEIDTVPCLPIPIPPDYDRYVQIASILALCLLLTIFEPYGLRWRNWILCYYYPRRAKERAVWLYNHILRGRSSFLKFARRQLRRKMLGGKQITKVTCMEYLRSRTNNKYLLLFLGSDKQQACLLCGEVFRKSDKDTPIRCQRPGCTAIYCQQCFQDLDNVCTVCLSPIEYGDLSDFSEERDSSNEEYNKLLKPDIESEEFDSGMTSDEATGEEGSTDEYSYGYQEAEKLPSIYEDYKTKSSRDLEKQSSPDYVSTQYFNDEIELYNLQPFGFEDKDEETQFPDESSISGDPNETSSVASSFEKDKADHQKNMEDQSCHCLDLDYAADDPTSELLLEEFKQKSFNKDLDGISEEAVSTVPFLQPIQEQTEDEALIQFSSDEENELKSTFVTSSEEKFSSSSTMTKRKLQKPPSQEERQDDMYTVKSTVEEKLISDSDYSEEDLKRFIEKSETINTSSGRLPHSSDSADELKDQKDAESTISSGKKETTGKISVTSGQGESEASTKLKTDKVRRISSSTSISSPETDQERRIEFIGLQKKKQKTATTISPTQDTKKYQSTVSTKTSKQNVPVHLKQRRSILKADSGSSVLTEIKDVRGKPIIPKLNQKINNRENRTISSTSRSDQDKQGVRHGSVLRSTKGKIDPSQMRKSRKTDKTEKRLKGGANISIFSSEVETTKFLRESQLVESIPCHSSEKEAYSSPIHLLRSEPCSLSSIQESLHAQDYNLTNFNSSDTSLSPLYLGKHSSSSSSPSTHGSNIEHSIISDSMSKDIKTSTRSSIEGSIQKSGNSNSTKKAVRLSLEDTDTEGTTDEERTLGDTDASSDISVSVKENILGIPRSQRKIGKIDWDHETEIKSELPEEALEDKQRKLPEDSEETEDKRKGSSEETSPETKKSIDKKSSKGNNQNNETESPVEPSKDIDDNTPEPPKMLLTSEKFQIQDDDPKFMEARSSRKCSCCKCKNKLPITHHIPGGDPDRRILLQTGVDSCTQTSIDRSDQSSQIEVGCKSTSGGLPALSSNKCKLKAVAERSEPEKHCPCSMCYRLKSFEESSLQSKDLEVDSRKKCSLPRRKTVGTFCKPQTRDQVSYTKRPFEKNQAVCHCPKFRNDSLAGKLSDESISSNNCSYYRDRLDLPYQDNEEYKRLVRELEEKLVARNRERVRKTMREFEKCSTRNENLRKPILYDDSSCGEEPILNKLVHLRVGDTGDKARVNPSVPWKKSVVKGVNTVETMPKEISPRPHRVPPRSAGYYHDRDPTHWQMDTGTGEWYRISDVDISEPYDFYEEESRYSQPIPVTRRRMVERYEDELPCEDCDDLNRRYGHRNNLLFCPRHRLERFPPRHRKR